MYFLAVAIADVWNLFKRRDDYSYRSLGASGGVSAVLFSYILLEPFGKIYMFFIPVGIPAFMFGGLYLLYCVYMANRASDNIGHTAHFTGSVFGFVFPLLFKPALLISFIEQIQKGI
jgi:membrane associated rhomboid family serine protease